MPQEFHLNQQLIKETNKCKVIRALWENSPVSRTDLAHLTGLNKATITNVITQIEAEDLVRDIGKQQDGGVGRNANLLMFNKNYGLCGGITIRHYYCSVAISNVFAEVLWQEDLSCTPEDNPLEIMEQIAALLQRGLEQCKEISQHLLGIGIGVASLITKPDESIYAIHSTARWHNIPLGTFFRHRFKVPIYVDTGTNLAMLGEHYFGAARNVSNALLIFVGSGIGGSLLINGHIFHGQDGFAGDFGHLCIDPNGPLCSCGNRGCWENAASLLALPPGLSLQEVIAGAEGGDLDSIRILSQIGQNLGKGAANLIRILNPEVVILGGDIPAAGKWVMNPCRTELQTKLWPLVWEDTRIQWSPLPFNSMMLGCFTIVIERIFLPLNDSFGEQ